MHNAIIVLLLIFSLCVKLPGDSAGYDAYPSLSEVTHENLTSMECGLPTQLSFSARETSDGTFFKAIEDYDPDGKRLSYQLNRWSGFSNSSKTYFANYYRGSIVNAIDCLILYS